MALFDFFRRKPKKEPEPEPVDDGLAEPRCHHYTFAHYALRSVAFAEPMSFLGVLASKDARKFLRDLMKSVDDHCQDDEPDFRAEDISIHRERVGRFPCAVIEMPKPQAITEAYFVAAVLLHDLSQRMPSGPEELSLRYFTLEKGFSLEGPSPTVLCEWTAEGSHVNYGDGPKPRREDFVRAVAEMVSDQPADP